MKRKLWSGLALLIFIVLIGWAFYPKPVAVDTATLRTGYFERSIAEDGRTRLRDRFIVSAPVAGRLERVTLREGDAVQRGQVVALLWPVAPALLDERRLGEQRAAVAAADAQLQAALAGVAKADAALARAESELRRQQQLAGRGFISPNRLETVELDATLRRRDRDAARQEAEAARHRLAQQRASLQQVAAGQVPGSRAMPVVSPVTGTVLRVRQQSEAVLAAGTPLVELGDPARLEVLVDLLTEDAAQVRPGTPAVLSNWGGETTLEARVRQVEPSAFTKLSALGVEEQRVNVLLDISSPPGQWQSLGDNYRVDVSIPVQTKAQASMVPVGCLFPRGSRSALFVLEQGRARLEEVELVARNGHDAWIRTRLPAGTVVIAYPPSSLKDGDRVRPLAD